MDAVNGSKMGFRISSRSMILAVVVVAVLTLSVAWSVQQSRLTHEAMDRALAAERAAAQAQANAVESQRPLHGKAKILRDEALRRAARRDPKDDERVRQLYSELDALMQVQDRIQQDIHTFRGQRSRPAAATGYPRSGLRLDPGTGSP